MNESDCSLARLSGLAVGDHCRPPLAPTRPADSRKRPEPLRPKVLAKFLEVDGERFPIRGVTYGSFKKNSQGEPFPEFGRLLDDFSRMSENGINLVRFYDPPSERIADAADREGLKLMVDVCWGPRGRELREPETLESMFAYTRENSRRLAGHPAMLLYSLGNEIPPLTVRWYGRRQIASFLKRLHHIVKEADPDALVTYVNHPPTEHLDPLLDFLDVVSYNVYFEDPNPFRAYLARLQSIAGSRPVLLAELGLDSTRNGEASQTEFFRTYLPSVYDKGLCGAIAYSWTDEWSIFQESIDGWGFGLTTADRTPKPALQEIRTIYRQAGGLPSSRDLPKASVIVCTYNGRGTLEACLRSLSQLRYPDYEVIVVDDGSSVPAKSIADQFPVRYYLQPENGGLSRARNFGMEVAGGEIVAYIDDDAEADPDWLYFLVTALLDNGAAGVGGPNLPHPSDGFVAQCVDQSPGNPIHVLLDDESAEHVPGCNMAYRKRALAEFGGFDPSHRIAGDDVDVCWKILTREAEIAFSPAAIVWHHRRPTIGRFLRQQRSYGAAEAHLVARHPGRFNLLGYGAWQGRIYASQYSNWLAEKLSLFGRSKVYQGRFAGASFQCIYHPRPSHTLAFATGPEWLVLTLLLTASAVVAAASTSPILTATYSTAVVALASVTGVAALGAGLHAADVKRWDGARKRQGVLIVAFLSVAQPLVRMVGRLRETAKLRLRGKKSPFQSIGYLWGNLEKRERWLELMQRQFRACGWVAVPSDDWAVADLDIVGPGPVRATVCTTFEEVLNAGDQHLRFRIVARNRPWATALGLVFAVGVPASFLHPTTVPLALVSAVVARYFLLSGRHVTRAISHIAFECAAALDMPRAEEPAADAGRTG